MTELVGAELPVAWKPLFDGTSITVVVFGFQKEDGSRPSASRINCARMQRDRAVAPGAWWERCRYSSGDGAAVVSCAGRFWA